jgi:hypothetical protein
VVVREVPRRRREVPDWTIVLLRPVLRYSASREAFVLRGLGNRMGPVLQRRRDER